MGERPDREPDTTTMAGWTHDLPLRPDKRRLDMQKKLVRTIALAATFALGACGETDVEMGELTEAEAEDLAEIVMLTAFSSGTSSVPAPTASGPQQAPYEYTESVSGTVPCQLDGSVQVTADVVVSGDTETDDEALDFTMTQVHDACAFVSQRQREFTLYGAPSLTLDMLIETNGQGVVEMSTAISGAVDWETDGREGRCTVGLEFEARLAQGESLEADLAGTVCGFDVTKSLTVG